VIRKKVNVLIQRGNNTQKIFEYGRDLLEVERVEDTNELITALIGIGKPNDQGIPLTFHDYNPPLQKEFEKKEDWIGNREARHRWGKKGQHIFGIYKDEQAQNPVELFNRTLQQIKRRSRPRVTYKMDVLVLEKHTDYQAHQVRLGDTVRVKDQTFHPELLIEARVIERKRSKTNPSKDIIVLASYSHRTRILLG
jgi:phage minor structural protein